MEKLPKITEQEWIDCNPFNRKLRDEFIENSTSLSNMTKKAYQSNLAIWFNYVRQYCGNKEQILIKPMDFMKYQNWLVNKEHSTADISNKRAAVSSLNNYIMLYYGDEYPTFHNFINKSIRKPPPNPVHEKIPPTKEEMENLINELERREDWQKLAYIKFSYKTGCRRAEARQLRKDFINAEPVIKTIKVKNDEGIEEERVSKYYITHKIRCKGAGSVGKVRQLKVSDYAMDALKKWVDIRGEDDCEFMFVTKYGGKIKNVSENTFNQWSSGLFTEIVGRRINPHIFRAARASNSVLEDGKSIESVQKLLGHASQDTTRIYIVGNENDDESDELFVE